MPSTITTKTTAWNTCHRGSHALTRAWTGGWTSSAQDSCPFHASPNPPAMSITWIADGDGGKPIMWQVRLIEGKDRPTLPNGQLAYPSKWEQQGYSKTVNLLLDMTEPLHGMEKVETGDSRLCVMKCFTQRGCLVSSWFRNAGTGQRKYRAIRLTPTWLQRGWERRKRSCRTWMTCLFTLIVLTMTNKWQRSYSWDVGQERRSLDLVPKELWVEDV